MEAYPQGSIALPRRAGWRRTSTAMTLPPCSRRATRLKIAELGIPSRRLLKDLSSGRPSHAILVCLDPFLQFRNVFALFFGKLLREHLDFWIVG